VSEPTEPRARIEVELRRIGDRLIGASPAEAEQHAPAVRDVLQHLADAAARIEANDEPAERRTVPELPVTALGDQLAVLGTDLLVAASGRPGHDPLLLEVADRLTALRRTL